MMALELEAVDLKDLLSTACRIVKEKAAAQRISLVSRSDEDLGSLAARHAQDQADRLQPAVECREVQRQRGRVIAAREARSAAQRRRAARDAAGACISARRQRVYEEFVETSVSDSGIGISTADMEKLFQAFQPDRQQPRAQIRGHGPGPRDGQAARGAARRQRRRGRAGRRRRVLRVWLPLRPSERACRPFRRRVMPPHAATEPGKDLRWWSKTTTWRRTWFACCSKPRVLRSSWRNAEAASYSRRSSRSSLITLDIHLPGIDGWEFLRGSAKFPQSQGAGGGHFRSGAGNLALNSGASAVIQKADQPRAAQASLASLGLHPAEEHTATVLVVDDDPKAVEVIAAFLPAPCIYGGPRLRRQGSHCAGASKRPDLILLDLMMPDVNGFDVVEALRRIPADGAHPDPGGDRQAHHSKDRCASIPAMARRSNRREGRLQPGGVHQRSPARLASGMKARRVWRKS
jgi:CheY-like chemotaxis protein